MNFYGVLIGVFAFLAIGVFHPLVTKGEYYFGKGIWPAFLILGILAIVAAVFIESVVISAIIAVIGFSSLWSIHEIIEQEERVRKGWFPKNPKRDYDF